MLLKQEKKKIVQAEMKDLQGVVVIVNTIDDNMKNVICDLIFKQKILLEKRELNKQEAMKALDLGYSVKIINDIWCDDENTLSVYKDHLGRMVVYENGKETDEYLPEEYLTSNAKYFLEGTVYEGEYIPF